MIDLTTLEGQDTPGKVRALCAKAQRPDPSDPTVPKVATICVYPDMVPVAVEALGASGIHVARPGRRGGGRRGRGHRAGQRPRRGPVRGRGADTGAGSGWRMLRGDEVGALLGTHLVRRDSALTGTVAAPIVSSSLLGRIAVANGLGYVETLTGFKWISRVEGLRFGYEEALGYCVDPAAVRDKDGISAEDLAVGSVGLPPTDGLRYRLEGAGRVIVRPSRTEPKLKCYLEVVVPVGAGDVAAARRAASEALAAITADLQAALGL